MDIFEKRLSDRGPLGQYQKVSHGYFTFPKLEGELGSRMMFQGKERIVWSINNYLGLANHPEVRQVDAEAAAKWGLAYPMGARMMSGESKIPRTVGNRTGPFCSERYGDAPQLWVSGDHVGD